MNKKRDKQEESLSLHPSSLSPPPSLRLFFAVGLPAEVRARAGEHIADLRTRLPEVRAGWERAEKLHVTLKFLGEIEEPRVSDLQGAARRAAQGVSAFGLRIEGAGSLPPRGLPRILWLGVADSSGALARLQDRLEEECASAGFKREARAFHPHITIARLRRPDGARQLAILHEEKGFAPAEVSVADFLLVRSELGPGGARHTELSRHPLGGE